MARRIPVSKVEGISSRQAHADLPEGSYERELGRDGFFGSATQMYHRHPPTGWTEIEGDLKPRAFDLKKLANTTSNPWHASAILHNSHVNIRYWNIKDSMTDLVRNADGDELLFMHAGSGHLYCDYGHMQYREGDYILLPRGTMWRLEIEQTTAVLLIEATGSQYGLPDKGIMGEHAIFDPAMLDSPKIDSAFTDQQHENETRVVVKRHQSMSTMTFPYNPLDAIGWHGSLMPVRINWRDIRPLMSHRYHVPPSAHTTFLTDRFVVCTFCPRPIESDPGALKVPFYHNNDDYDEVIFYHQGEFFSRDNIHPGMLTLHPSGVTHGPHPNAFAAGKNHAKKQTDEVAVMIDSLDALNIANLPEETEWHEYVYSWQGDKK